VEALEQKNTEGRPDDKPTEVPLLDAPTPSGPPEDDAADPRQAARRTARQSARQAKPKPAREPAAELPYAQVVLALELSHLDRAFDYLVPADLDDDAQPGVRVRVRFAGQLVDGFIISRVAESDFAGRFEWLQKVVSPLPVLTPEILDLARTVADRYAGTLADVLRLAVPPRHAAAEKASAKEPGQSGPSKPVDGAPWGVYGGGREFIKALQRKTAPKLPRAVWTCLPATDWATAIATAMHAVATDAVVFPEPDPVPVQAPVSENGEESETADDPAIPDLEPDPTDPALPDPDLPTDYDIDPENLRDLDDDRYSDAEAQSSKQSADVVSEVAMTADPLHVPARGALAIVPDHRDLARLDAALTAGAFPRHHAALSADLRPPTR